MARPSKLTAETEKLICGALRAGVTLEDAALVAGVTREVVWRWTKLGSRVAAYQDRVDKGAQIRPADPDQFPHPTAYERRCAAFFHAIRQARAEMATQHAMTIADAGLRPSKKTTVRTKQVLDKDGEVITLIEKVEEISPPDWKASLQLLARRLPQEWGATSRTELSGPDGGPIPLDEVAAGVLARLAALDAGGPSTPGSDVVVDAEVVEDDDDGGLSEAAVRELLEG